MMVTERAVITVVLAILTPSSLKYALFELTTGVTVTGPAPEPTVSAIVVALEVVPLVPVMVTVADPEAAVLEAAKVTVLVVVLVAGLNDAVTPAGRPPALNVTTPVNPPTGRTVSVLAALDPAVTDRLAGLAVSVKPAGGVRFTVRLIWTTWLRMPLVPVMLITDVPARAVFDTDRVTTVPDVEEIGLKLAVTPVGKPLAVNVTEPVKAPDGVTVMALVPLPGLVTTMAAGAAESAKSAGGGDVTVTITETVRLMVPLTPETVIVAGVLSAAPFAAVKVSVVPLVDEIGLKLAATPAGRLLALKVTVPVKPPDGVTVMTLVPLAPELIDADAGLADSENAGPPPDAASSGNMIGTRGVTLFVFTVSQSDARIPPVSPESGFQDQNVQSRLCRSI